MSHQVFAEFEAYTDAIQDADMRVTLTRAPERPLWSIRHLQIDSLHIQTGSDGSGNIAEGATRRDGWTLVWQTRTRGAYLANGELLTRDSMLVLSPGAEFHLACGSVHDWISAFVPTASLFPPANAERPCSSRVGRVVCPGHELTNRLQTTIDTFMAAAELDRSVTTEPASVSSFREVLCCIAQRIIRGPVLSVKAEGRSIDRHHLVSQALNLIEQWPHMSPTVRELARGVGVSERTLRSAFADCLGTSPYQYLVARRMSRARQLLLDNDRNELSVRSAAAKVGFWDVGRFAGKYRRLFAELPSETVRRKRTGA